MGVIRDVTERQLQIAGIVLEGEKLFVEGKAGRSSQGKLFAEKETDKYSQSNLPLGDKEGVASPRNETKVQRAEAYEKKLADELLLIREKKQQLYEDWKEGMLTSADYEYRKEQLTEKQLQYEKEQEEQRKRVEQIKAEQEKMAALENC